MDTRSDHERKRAVHQGTVKLFDRDRGYGFIIAADDQEVFFHHSAICATDRRTLAQGDRVEYEIVMGPKGLPQAGNVRKTESSRP